MIIGAFSFVTLWGVLSNFLCWFFRITQHPTLELSITILRSFLPTVLIPGSGYFMYFCLGYFFRRFAKKTSDCKRNQIIVFGLVLWVTDVIFAYFEIDRFDPSYPWLFSTVSVLFIFDRIRIINPILQRAIEWTARRSYSVYLVQYTVIAFVSPFLYDAILHGQIDEYGAIFRISFWVIVVLLSYLLSLGIASFFDFVLLHPLQIVYHKIIVYINKLINSYNIRSA